MICGNSKNNVCIHNSDGNDRFHRAVLNMCRHKNIGFGKFRKRSRDLPRILRERIFSAKGHLPEDKDNGAD